MRIVEKQAEMAALALKWRKERRSIGFVPTMGALHAGHASLIGRARRENRRVVVLVFVNPAQFRRNDGYDRYARGFSCDRKLCAAFGADVIYCPRAGEVYPAGFSTCVEVARISDILCGRFRPGHFK